MNDVSHFFDSFVSNEVNKVIVALYIQFKAFFQEQGWKGDFQLIPFGSVVFRDDRSTIELYHIHTHLDSF
jgi:hypothetical protein